MKLEISDGAERDLIDGARFYEEQSPGLGQYFLDSLFSDIESLRLYAGIHSRQHGHYRLLSKRFPYAVYYLLGKRVIEVRAVLDCRRNPTGTRQRLTRR